jgi:hypothetical protein
VLRSLEIFGSDNLTIEFDGLWRDRPLSGIFALKEFASVVDLDNFIGVLLFCDP